jgi:hypothetical protein
MIKSAQAPAALLAYAGAILFAALFLSIGLQSPAPISPLLGLACHFVLFPVVALLPAPAWARAGGYGWLIGDITLNVAAWNIAPMGFSGGEMHLIQATFDSLRQGIHLSAGLWIAAASWETSGPLRMAGVLAAAILALAALGGPWLPIWAVYPGYGLLIVWLVLVGRHLVHFPPKLKAKWAITNVD